MGKEGKMMRKTMEKMKDYDIKQWKKWESNGKFEQNAWKIDTRGKTVERIGRG